MGTSSAATAPESSTTDDESSKSGKERGPAMTERLIAFADEHFEVFRAQDGRMYGTLIGQPGRAYAHGKPSPLVNQIKHLFYAQNLKWPDSKSAAAVTDYLEVMADHAPVREVALRSTWNGTRFLVDVGDEDWSVLEIDAGGWRVHDDSPVAFRRSSVTAALALPGSDEDRAEFDDLWALAPVSVSDRPLVLALLITSWMTGVSQPVVYVTGTQDSGKTETARTLLRIVDPVTIDERGGSLPVREDDWKSRVSTNHCILIDNASHITSGMSDTLCKVATGGELITRTLYTNDTAHISAIQSPVWLTAIGVGALRGDLQSRMVTIELNSLGADQRIDLETLRHRVGEAMPSVLRALLDLTVKVLGLMPDVDRTRLNSRLTTFEIVLRCVDQILGTDGCARLTTMSEELAEDVLDSDPVAMALLAAIDADHTTEHQVVGHTSPTAIHAALTYFATEENRRAQSWPRTPKAMSDHLKRVAPALGQVHGIRLIVGHRSNGKRLTLVDRGAYVGRRNSAAGVPQECRTVPQAVPHLFVVEKDI